MPSSYVLVCAAPNFHPLLTLYLIITIPRLYVLVSFGVGDTMVLFSVGSFGAARCTGECPPWDWDVFERFWVGWVHWYISSVSACEVSFGYSLG